MANTGFGGVNVRQTSDRLFVDAFLQDGASPVAKVISGTGTYRLFEKQSDGTLKSYDFADNTFKTTALGAPTGSLTHRTGDNSTYNTGIWTATLNTLAGFTAKAMYLIEVTHASAVPPVQYRQFQFGSAEGDLTVTSSCLDVNAKYINNVATTSVTVVAANIGTTQPVNFTGTSSAAYIKVDAIDLAGQPITAAAGVTFPSSIPTAAQNAVAVLTSTVTGTTYASGEVGYLLSTYLNSSIAALRTVADSTQTAVGLVVTSTSTIQAKTDQLTFTTPFQVDSNALSGTSSAPTAAQNAQAVWTSFVTGTTYAFGEAGFLLATYLDTTVSSRLASASYTAPDNAAVINAIWAKTMTELSAVPGINASVLAAITFGFELARNKITQTSSTQTIYKDDGTTVLCTAAVSDDLTTFARGEFS